MVAAGLKPCPFKAIDSKRPSSEQAEALTRKNRIVSAGRCVVRLKSGARRSINGISDTTKSGPFAIPHRGAMLGENGMEKRMRVSEMVRICLMVEFLVAAVFPANVLAQASQHGA